MRSIRALMATTALTALVSQVGAAQSTRGFKDSWFWGAKVGAIGYSVSSNPGAISPVLGIDWLITRTRFGVYAGFDQAFFNQFALVNDSLGPQDTVPRQVNLRNMRRFTAIAVAFPMATYWLQPYVGGGFALNQIATINPVGTFRSSQQRDLVTAVVQNFRVAFTPTFMAGAQLRLLHFSAFAQGMVGPANREFFLYNTRNYNFSLETGLRFNIGSSIDKMQ